MFHDPMGGVKTGDGRRRDEREHDQELEPHRSGEKDQKLTDAEDKARADKANQNAAR